MARRKKDPRIATRFRDRAGRFTPRDSRRKLKGEAYDLLSGKTLSREKEFRRGKVTERAQTLKRSAARKRFPPIPRKPPPLPPPPPPTIFDWFVQLSMESEYGPPKTRSVTFEGLTESQFDTKIGEYTNAIQEQSGFALSVIATFTDRVDV